MTLTRAVFVFSFTVLALPQPLPAESIPDPFAKPNIRVTDPWVRQLLEAGMTQSLTFRSLVERLDGSDVVVYIQRDALTSPGVAGRLTFLSTVAETRYLLIRLAPLRSIVQQLSILGHELQHAVEVAENPAMVDSASMYREYLRIGYLNGMTDSGVAVDTRAAVEAGGRISTELRDAPFVFRARLLP